MDSCQRPAGLRLFRSQHSRSKGSQLYDVSRPGRSNADDMAREHSVYGVVPSVSPASRTLSPGARPAHRLCTEADELFSVPSMTTEKFWRTLDEYDNFEEFQKALQDEFRPGTVTQPGVVDRREFLSLMSASLALAGLTSCAPSVPEKIVPYVRAPEEIVPGKPLFFATAFPLAGYALGILAESQMGRPTKIEGNPDHPASLGSTDAFAQASVLSLYDPERSKVITQGGRISTWDAFITALSSELEAKRLSKGEGLRI